MTTPRKRAPAPAPVSVSARTFSVQVYVNTGESVRLTTCRVRFSQGDFRDNIVFVGKESADGLALLVGEFSVQETAHRWTPYGFGCVHLDDVFMIRELFDLELRGNKAGGGHDENGSSERS